ncbi:hypothetical protein [Desulfotruncus alcoholivorax]|uniref:hypothetical protein n=1 Tax=Desulfotruncus alcoholivorax TaxID=265477 RepID=UPI00040E1ACE|nr:hypothetical protein [Desulfotruncus alcoholivorax]
MIHEYIIAALNRDQLEAACRIAEENNIVVFGTMDGDKLKRVGNNVPIYFYEPG